MNATTVRIGAHVDSTDPVGGAAARGLDVVQIFNGDPQAWKGHSVLHPDGADSLKASAAKAGVAIYVHSPYIINVATTNNRIRIPSRKILQTQMDLAESIGARGVIVHGGHVTQGDDPAKGFDNWRKAIEATDIKVPLLIENTAGGDLAMARTLERIGGLWAAIESAAGAENVGFCLDTCHAHAGGNSLETIVDDIVAITGRLDLVHLNDSRDEFDSGADRHANLGQGHAGAELLAHVAREAAKHGAPALLETPGGADEHRADAAWLREHL